MTFKFGANNLNFIRVRLGHGSKKYGLETISCLDNAVAWICKNQAGVGERGWPFGTNQLILIT